MKRLTSAEIGDFVSKANIDEKIILGKDPSWPKISIITPSYNQGQFLERTIISVLNQNYPNLEYIVMDGGSSDGSVEIIRRYADKLIYWKSAPDKGQSAAIADGFALASGDIIGWLNSDDMFVPNALINVANAFLAAPEICAVTGRCVMIDTDGKPFAVGIPIIRCWRSMLYLGSGFYQMATFWKKSAYEAVGQLNTEMYFSFDADLFVRLRRYGEFKVIPNYLAAYRYHKSTKTSNSSRIMRADDRMIQKKYSNVNDITAILSRVARRLRPVQRIRNRVFWYKDKTVVSKLCAIANAW
jgi:glycosyltransferase involved in cell wall biosynthesis